MDLAEFEFDTTSVDHAQAARSVCAILDAESLCTIATVTPEGSPHVNCSFYAQLPDGRLVIWTSPKTRHSRNVELSPHVAVSVANSSTGWGTHVAGLQLFGTCRPATGLDAARCFAAYAKKFSSLLKWAKAIEDIDRAFESRFYTISIDRLTVIDEAQLGSENYIDAIKK